MDNGASSYLRFLDGDNNGIVEIIRDYKDGLILFLNRCIHNIHIAEKLAEDTFVRIVTKKPRFAANYSFKTWYHVSVLHYLSVSLFGARIMQIKVPLRMQAEVVLCWVVHP